MGAIFLLFIFIVIGCYFQRRNAHPRLQAWYITMHKTRTYILPRNKNYTWKSRITTPSSWFDKVQEHLDLGLGNTFLGRTDDLHNSFELGLLSVDVSFFSHLKNF
jgi:hypothetical protein